MRPAIPQTPTQIPPGGTQAPAAAPTAAAGVTPEPCKWCGDTRLLLAGEMFTHGWERVVWAHAVVVDCICTWRELPWPC